MDDPVVSRSGVMGGQPCFGGTRVPVDALFVNLAAGDPLDLILLDYPTIDPRAAVAALRWGLTFVRREALERSDVGPAEQERLGDVQHGPDWERLTDRLSHRIDPGDGDGTRAGVPARSASPDEWFTLSVEGVRGTHAFLRRRGPVRGDPDLYTSGYVPVAAILPLMREGWGDRALLDLWRRRGLAAGELACIRARPDLFGRSLAFAEALGRMRERLSASAREGGGHYKVWLPWRGPDKGRTLPPLLQEEPIPPHPAEGPADLGIVAFFSEEASAAAAERARREAAQVGLTLTDGFCFDGPPLFDKRDAADLDPDETWGEAW